MSRVNKWVVIPIIVILTLGTITNGAFYIQENNKMKNAELEIAALREYISAVEGNVSILEEGISTYREAISSLENNTFILEGAVSTLGDGMSTLEDNVSILNDGISTLGDGISILGDGISTLGDGMSILEGNLSTVEGDVSAMEGDVFNLQGDVYNLKGDVYNLEWDFSLVEGDVSLMEGDVSLMEGDVSTLEGNVSAMEGNVSAMEGNVSDLEEDVSTLEGNVSALEAHDNAVLDVVAMVAPAVVRIEALLGEAHDDHVHDHDDLQDHDGSYSSGSGVMVSSNGYVLTNYHVIEGAILGSIEITLMNGETYGAAVVASDPARDLALLVTFIPRTDFPEAVLGSSADITIGEEVVAAGYALGLSGQATFTTGIVSAIRIDDFNGFEYIQTDAAINFGSSGGVLVNLEGEVIGITTWGYIGEGTEALGFAIPIDAVKLFIQEAIGR